MNIATCYIAHHNAEYFLMTFVHYQPNFLPDQASYEEATIAITSSQILLSRDIANTRLPVTRSPEIPASTLVPSIFESNTQHIMTLGEAADLGSTEQTVSQGGRVARSSQQEFATNRSSSPRTMIWTMSQESFSTALDSQLSPTTSSPCVDNDESNNGDESDTNWPGRGRLLRRDPRYANPLARAESRPGRADALIELNPASIGKRISHSGTFLNDSTQPFAILDDRLLEPGPRPSACATVSEVLHASCEEPSGYSLATELYPSKRLRMHSPTVAAGLPAEIVQQIYYSLSPVDFNSARHTCRSWFINSLERSLLNTMCKRGGISGNVQEEISANHDVFRCKTFANDEWLISKRLSRECALGPDWKGNGLNSSGFKTTPAFLHTATVDFTEAAVHNGYKNSAGTLFTVSNCGRFLLSANGCLVFVYELNRKIASLQEDSDSPGSLRPVTSIICPARVLACSMDTSSARYAIAVLLDGRMGMVCDITSSKISKRRKFSGQIRTDQNIQAIGASSFLNRVSFNTSGEMENFTNQRFVFPGIAASGPRDEYPWRETYTQSTQTSDSSFRHGSISRLSVLSQSRLDKRPVNQTSGNEDSTCPMPIENGPRSLYHNICSEDDPPRSVAICPQRRCVAFGCSSGIELHWVDALTGQDLNRWFPLTSPSDFLFFLPPRKRIDSAKKLRLISSAARPCERTAIANRVFGGRPRRSQCWQRLGWNQDPENTSDYDVASNQSRFSGRDTIGFQFNGRADYSDHFRAVPLSDGYHVLFTDPASGYLCLGSDAPVGGPTKLIRKIWFKSPAESRSPTMYASGFDLTCGVRVVAAYGMGTEQTVYLFSVPSDIFTAQNGDPTTPNSHLWTNKGSKEKNMEWTSWWSGTRSVEREGQTGVSIHENFQQNIWPIQITGQAIGKCTDVIDLAVDSGPSMIIWAFGKDGISTVWKLDCGRLEEATTRLVMQDGTIREVDEEGDVEMAVEMKIPGAFGTSPSGNMESLDGTSSLDGEACAWQVEGTAQPSLKKSAWSSQEGRYDFEHLVWTILESGTVNQTPHWTRCGYRRKETDFIARLDIQIH